MPSKITMSYTDYFEHSNYANSQFPYQSGCDISFIISDADVNNAIIKTPTITSHIAKQSTIVVNTIKTKLTSTLLYFISQLSHDDKNINSLSTYISQNLNIGSLKIISDNKTLDTNITIIDIKNVIETDLSLTISIDYTFSGIRKFVDTLPSFGIAGKNNLDNYIPVATPDTVSFPGDDYYVI